MSIRCTILAALVFLNTGHVFAQTNSMARATGTLSPTNDFLMPAVPNRMQIYLQNTGRLVIKGTYFDDYVGINRVGSTLILYAEQRRDGGAFWDTYREYSTDDVSSILFEGYSGNDSYFASNSCIYSYIDGGEGADTIAGPGQIHGGDGDDVIIATAYDTYWGRSGATVFGEGGNDIIWGSGLPDILIGGSGFNTIYGDEDDQIVNASNPLTLKPFPDFPGNVVLE